MMPMTCLRFVTALALLASSVSAIAAPAAAQVEVGLHAPPLRYPVAVVSYDAHSSYRLELHLTHQQGTMHSLTQVGLRGLRMLDPVERGPISFQPTLGLGVAVGTVTVRVAEASSTTPAVSLILLASVEHQPSHCPCTVVAQVGHSMALQPVGLGWGASLGVRVPLTTLHQVLSREVPKP